MADVDLRLIHSRVAATIRVVVHATRMAHSLIRKDFPWPTTTSFSARSSPFVSAREGEPLDFTATCRIDMPVEIEYYLNGGILHTVLRN